MGKYLREFDKVFSFFFDYLQAIQFVTVIIILDFKILFISTFGNPQNGFRLSRDHTIFMFKRIFVEVDSDVHVSLAKVFTV